MRNATRIKRIVKDKSNTSTSEEKPTELHISGQLLTKGKGKNKVNVFSLVSDRGSS